MFDLETYRGRRPTICGSDACRRSRAARRAREYYAARRAAGGDSSKTTSKVTCSGCGESRLAGGSENPDRICHACRRQARVRSCLNCLVAFDPKNNLDRKYCSLVCFRTRSDSETARRKQLERWRRKNRARRSAVCTGSYETYEIAHRDGFRCQLCKSPVDMTLSGMEQWGPTIDHVIPLAKGGVDGPENVQLAHRICNLRKGVG